MTSNIQTTAIAAFPAISFELAAHYVRDRERLRRRSNEYHWAERHGHGNSFGSVYGQLPATPSPHSLLLGSALAVAE